MSKTIKKPELIIVGAGPGDPDLITVKGLKAIERAQVILYDALASPELLKYAQPDCKLISVGKRKGRHTFPQDEINQLIVFYASRYGTVVRLKGGDPYVFGRGHEELEYAQRRGIQVEVIPGLSSSLAAPASVGIPLTKRGVNESFWVSTGTCTSGQASDDLLLAAQSGATVVILMGMANLNAIVTAFCNVRGKHEPIAIVQEATTSNEKIVIGDLDSIESLVKENAMGSPAVIVIGRVVEEAIRHDRHSVSRMLAHML